MKGDNRMIKKDVISIRHEERRGGEKKLGIMSLRYKMKDWA